MTLKALSYRTHNIFARKANSDEQELNYSVSVHHSQVQLQFNFGCIGKYDFFLSLDDQATCTQGEVALRIGFGFCCLFCLFASFYVLSVL